MLKQELDMKRIKNNLNKGVFIAGLTALFLQCAPVHAATVISFDRLATSWEAGPLFDSVTDSGFTVQATGAPFFISSGSADDCTPQCAEKDSQYMATQTGHEAISVFKNDGGLFNLHSFEFSERHINHDFPAQIHVTGHVWDGSVVTATFLFDGINDGSGPLKDFQTAVLPDSFRSLSSIEFVSDAFNDSYGLDTIVTVELDDGVITPTLCEQTHQVSAVTTTGGGQSAVVNEQIRVMFTGHLMTQSGLTSGGKNAATICHGTSIDYKVLTPDIAASCTVDGDAVALTGKLLEGQQLICTNKPAGGDTDRFTVKAGR